MSSPHQSTRPLMTSARVHPSYLPFIHNASRSTGKGMKWVPPLVTLVGVGYGVAAYREAQIGKHLASAAAADKAEAERRRKNAALADAYGDRNSIEALEHAMRVYEAQQGNE
ncbi:hypothetical protein B0T22DRAFT_439196 [Podospora appendiculata]|uniref:Uncharacterized protein n=1 Tax=Podospora appendiculata TaxID=314037 RepID=A0AAE0X7M1_9PEZI|nr:hypothetical protein B0T22DRAFT_389020 [Podospora appendiculata]KAK3687583.1 hypothetical protein B0T22DRAFT_439196 [Podospora appendiculata]